ncbi:MBOAT family protein [Candidatus Dependentiae bacterium]|nr:MBOAT family protein [Candidatus Dependentiae bacterium]
MLFNSFEFIFIFLPVVLTAYYLISNHRSRLWLLLISSYFFYGWWNYKFLSLLLLSTSLDYYLGLLIYNTQSEQKRKKLLILSVITNLGILGFFKYFNFFVENFYTLSSLINNESSRTFFLEIVLPVGISFYTFQSMSYTIDVYYKKTQPHRDFMAFASYVALFPQLVAGPIIRHSDLVYQLEDASRGKWNGNNFARGLFFFVIGLSKKIIIADHLAGAIDPALDNLDAVSTLESWLCALGYTFQIYFDFSGYSDMAIGLGWMMNFHFITNFNSPYKSKSITEFWQRWHISLSAWLKDYLYIPLGGNRNGLYKTYRNLFLTMLLGGLWHGANWVYVIWGAYHGILLAIERALGFHKKNTEIPPTNKIIFSTLKKRIITFFLIIISWVFFRSPDISFSFNWFKKLFSPPFTFSLYQFSSRVRDKYFAALVVSILISFLVKNTSELNFENYMHKRYAFLLGLLLCLCLVFFTKNSPFLYFQF